MTNVLVGSGPLALRPAANLPNIEYHDTDHNIIWRCDGVNWSVVAGSSLNANPMQGPGDLMAGGQEGVPVRVPAATSDGLALTSKASAAGGMDWEAGGGGASTLAALTDVTVTSPQEGDLLKYTSGKWENAAGALVKVLPATWSPADVTLDETATLLTIPAGAVTLAFAAKRATPTDAGSSPVFGLDDGLAGGSGLNAPNIALASDSNSFFFADGSSVVGQKMNTGVYLSNYYNVDTALVLAYTAGLTPGATKPVVKFRLAIIPNAFV